MTSPATAAVIAHASELGLSNVIGNLQGFINVDAAVLMSDFIYFLPADKVVLEILETVKVTPELVTRVRELVPVMCLRWMTWWPSPRRSKNCCRW
jgi:EAL and modified HD-GYP domain-containing signal transduction protein